MKKCISGKVGEAGRLGDCETVRGGDCERGKEEVIDDKMITYFVLIVPFAR